MDFWQEMGLALAGIVGEDEGKGVILSPQLNLIIVRALPSELREARCRRPSTAKPSG